MKKTSRNVPISSARYAESPFCSSSTLDSPPRRFSPCPCVPLPKGKRRQSTHKSSMDRRNRRVRRVPAQMRWAVALLAAALLLAGVVGCGGSGAEPGVPKGATLVLDFTPNPVHSGIYAAQAEGFYEDAGIDLHVQVPGESTDAPKLLAAGRTDFAILDITDLGIAAEKGLELVGVMPIVQAPLAAVLARRDGPVRRPRDMDGHQVGVTGLPSDTAVVRSEVAGDGGDPSGVDEVTIGFNAVASLAAGKVDAATGFWNAEAVEAERNGIPLRVFKVDEYGAPHYPELILTTTRKKLESEPELVESM